MNRPSHTRLLLAACGIGLFACLVLAGCSGERSAVPFSSLSGQRADLRALSIEAKTGSLSGAASTAWFSFKADKAGIPVFSKSRGGRGALEVTVLNEGPSPVSVSMGFVTAGDLGINGELKSSLPARPLSVATSVAKELKLVMMIPDSGPGADVRGFAVSVKGAADSRVKIVSAAVTPGGTGWERGAGTFWAGFEASGGEIDCAKPDSAGVKIVPGSTLALSFTGGKSGTPLKQNRLAFRAGSFRFGFRKTSGPGRTFVPSVIVASAPVEVVSEESSGLSGFRVIRNAPLALSSGFAPSQDEKASLKTAASENSVPILADPNMIIEWPQAAWRRSDREVFAWDRFPSVLIFDTADYAVQDRLFKRLAFFVEKQGYRGKLLTDAELAPHHAYNAHDYRADSLAEFFEAVRKQDFQLDSDELELRDILQAEGVIRKEGGAWVAGAGAVLSFSRESAGYLRYLFMAHEGFHGIYFVDPDFRAKVHDVYRSMDKKAIGFLETYFTFVGALGYDTNDPYLMENEFMAYLMQQPEDRVVEYFTGNIADRYKKKGGFPEFEKYIADTNASEFARAAHELNEYAFSRWGLAGGRIGLYFFD